MDERSRTFTWDDPLIGFERSKTLTGIDYLRALQNGDLPAPPIARLVDFTFTEVEPGRVTATLTPREFHYNPIGVVHGGIASTLLDTVMACAIQTGLPVGVLYTTVELSINFIRPLLATTGEIRAIGEVIHSGRRLAMAHGRIEDAAGKLYAHGKTTCMIVS